VTIMFQLFSAKDLQMLTFHQLLELKDIAIKAMNVNEDHKLEYYLNEVNKNKADREKFLRSNGRNDLPPPGEKLDKERRTLNVSTDTKPKPLPDTSPGHSMLKKRLNEVRQQLLDSRESAPYDEGSFDEATQSQSISDHRSKLGDKEKRILQWAVSCERDFIEFYDPLRRARDVAHEYFFEKTGQRPEGPDSAYSPFSSDHPLRRRSPGLYNY